MNPYQCECVVPNASNSRKRKRNPESWGKNKRKRLLHSGEEKSPIVECKHSENSVICMAHQLTETQLQFVHSLMYQDSDKIRQDAFITSLVSIEPVQRRRPRSESPKVRSFTAKYAVPLRDPTVRLKVCAAAFRSILGVTAKRVNNLVQYASKEKESRPENRGGYRFTRSEHEEKKQLVRKHIESFPCKDSHYARAKAPHRQYLSSSLNVARMHSLFLEANPNIEVSYKAYYNMLVSEYNVAFGEPRCDVCSTCTKFAEKLRLEQDEDSRKKIVVEQALHRFRARKFYALLREEQDERTITLCFDLMQNQERPRTPVGEAYYMRQQWQYFLGIVECHRSGGKPSETVVFYTWGENQAGRGSNEIGSALYDYLSRKLPAGITRVRLFSDNCPGQNKNFPMIAMLSAFAARAKITVEYVFPIRGHSYLPADRAFGRVEKRIRRHETILLPSGYFEEFRKEGEVLEYPADWIMYDFKKFAKDILKTKQAFKISEQRRLRITGNSLHASTDFSAPMTEFSILRRGHRPSNFKPADLIVAPHNRMKDNKKRDVMRLLDIIGVDERHPAYHFYRASCDSTPREEHSDSDDSSRTSD